MKRILPLSTLAAAACLAATDTVHAEAPVPSEIEDHRVTHLHKLPPRGTAWPEPVEEISKVDPADAAELRDLPEISRLFKPGFASAPAASPWLRTLNAARNLLLAGGP
jgi:hypothetical protein